MKGGWKGSRLHRDASKEEKCRQHRRFKAKLAGRGLTMLERIQEWIEADVKDVDLRRLDGR
jgi:hypothetical protein